MAAINSPINGIRLLLLVIRICWISQELEFRQNHVIARINPISPIRLYKIAWRAAVFASVRPYHHPISRKDMMPTPSHPINS